MTYINDGGPAYPLAWRENEHGERGHVRSAGMTLRDRFAMSALEGLIKRFDWQSADYAKGAYKIADAMLAERNKPRAS